VITPAAEAVEPSAATATPASVPAVPDAPAAVATDLGSGLVTRALPVTVVELRSRRLAPTYRAAVRRQAKPRLVRKAGPAKRTEWTWATRGAAREQRSTTRGTGRRNAGTHNAAQRATRQRVTKHTVRTVRRTVGARRGMSAVIAYARAQVGKRYSSGGSGPNAFDCSGLTMQAFRRAGLRLPHSSGGQAARARSVSRSQARPGDLVVGPGHVGVYMGGGMMVDAGNRRTGVVFRRLYAGLHIERL
jgi:cell wall-associated NlpC family hydrolase